MKYLLLTCFAIGLFASVQAQSTNEDNGTLKARSEHRKLIIEILGTQAAPSLRKPTGIRQRVIAQASGSTTTDSTTYSYSGNRGSKFNYNLFIYNTILINVYEPNFIYLRSENALDVLADTIKKYTDNALRYKDYGTYTAGNKLNLVVTEYDSTFPFNRSWAAMTYNSEQFNDRSYYSTYNIPDPADTNFITQYSYSNGKVVTDSTWEKDSGNWSFSGITKHSYGANGRLSVDSTISFASGMPVLSIVRTLTYYPDNRLLSLRSFYYSNDTVRSYDADSFGYTGSIDYATFWEGKLRTFTGSVAVTKEIKYPGASGLPDSTRYTRITSSGQTEKIYRYLYNGFGNPEVISRFSPANPASPERVTRFYYETYDDQLAINELKDDVAPFVYPNPFGDRITITSNKAIENCSISLLDVLGRQVFASKRTLIKGNTTLSISKLAPGYYMMLLKKENGATWSKKMICQ